METGSAHRVMMNTNTTYDFSVQAAQAFGNNMSIIISGLWALFSGDINQDGTIDAFDNLMLDPDIINGVSGYVNTRINGDGTVDAFDYIHLDANLVMGASSILP